ncbi:MAG: hypothetical protein M1296_06035 [Chloroflexi bacterium]|nr:hypothetical protein [Chloroflexota bacterium]
MELGISTDHRPAAPTVSPPGARRRDGLDDLRLSLGLARRAAQIIRALADVERRDWRDAHAAAEACIECIDAVTQATGAEPERRTLTSLLRAQIYRAQDTLQEAAPERLKAFGPLAPQLRRDLTARVELLQKLLDALQAAVTELPPSEEP